LVSILSANQGGCRDEAALDMDQGDADLAVAEQVAHDCLDQRPQGYPEESCLDRGAADVFNELREEQGAAC
jgi:hypothetical protein